MKVNEKKIENTASGGAFVGKKDGQTIIHDKGTMSGYLVGKLHKDGGIKAVNKATGQPIEMQGGEVVITAPAVADQTKREFEGKMMTNREILSAINQKGGGVAFADGGEVPTEVFYYGNSYNYGGKMMTDCEIMQEISSCGCQHESKMSGGHLSKGKSLKQIAKMHNVTLAHIKKELAKGIKVESEHFRSVKERTRVAKDHLVENPNYYTILKKSGLKRGGKVGKQDLVKDAKRGNTPARDLNNYNDILDVQTDGELGGESGLFEDGGTTLPKVEKIYLFRDLTYSDAYERLVGKEYTNFLELKNDLIQAIDDNRAKRGKAYANGGFRFRVNDDDSKNFIFYFDDTKKNTVNNFNPKTGKNSDFAKVVERQRSLSFKKFDWNDFLGATTTKNKSTSSTQTKSTTDTSTSTTTAKSTPITQGIVDLTNTKIWIGDNPELSKAVQEKAFQLGWEWAEGDVIKNTEKKALYFKDDKIIVGVALSVTSKEDFDTRQPEYKEIFPEDLGIDSSLYGVVPTTSNQNLVVPKPIIVSKTLNLELSIRELEKLSFDAVGKFNTELYNKSLKLLYETKEGYELALKFTPESAYLFERLDIMKKLSDIEKKIKTIEDMKQGGAYFILAKILEKLEKGENWNKIEQNQDIITNKIPQSEIDVIIRSQKFKNWFGDWEKAILNDEYDNVSKALTNGLPSVYHHGARRIKYTYREVSNGVMYLAENESYALWFSQNATAQSMEGEYLTECFVNIKNPIDLTPFKVNQVDLGDLVRYIDAIYPMAKIYDFIPPQIAILIKTNEPTNIRMWAWQLIRSYVRFVKFIKENTPYDGFIYYENNPADMVINPSTGQSEENVTKAVAIFKSHQVKVVDAVLFDGGLDDWRFENGGQLTI